MIRNGHGKQAIFLAAVKEAAKRHSQYFSALLLRDVTGGDS